VPNFVVIDETFLRYDDLFNSGHFKFVVHKFETYRICKKSVLRSLSLCKMVVV